MHLSSTSQLKGRPDADLLVLPFWQDKKSAHPAFAASELSSLYALPVESGDFRGKSMESVLVYDAKQPEKRILLLGLGEEKHLTRENLKRALSVAVKVAHSKKCKTLNVVVPKTKKLKSDEVVRAVSDGIFLTNYVFDELKHDLLKEDPRIQVTHVCLIGVDSKGLELSKKCVKICASVDYVRDLVNGNADDVTPQFLGQKARELAKEFSSIKATVFDKKRIEKEKMGLLLAVNRGSSRDPAFIIIEYRGDPKSKETVAIVGKGITYDTGGLNLKPTGSMETMKCDMAGGATVLGTLRAAAALHLKRNLIGVIATTENAIGPDSYKPGDVYRSYSGKTVEISNTDAEGRLVLADALSYVQKHYEPQKIIDLATLTGGIVVALGEQLTGLFSNDEKFAGQLIQAGEKTDEPLWRMPLFADYKELLKSPIADLKNSAGRTGSAITAALFLQQFIKKTTWAHLDIAGSAFLTTPKYYNPTQATGVGVRLLIEYLER
jgi:leucyl aminopeptidase